MTIQPRRKGRVRQPLPACVLGEIHAAVDRLARRHGVSRSWVIATLLADALGVRTQPSYLTASPRRRSTATIRTLK